MRAVGWSPAADAQPLGRHDGDSVTRSRLILLALLAVLAIAFLAGPIRRFVAQDSCLDLGGRWIYATESCETVAPR